MKLNDNYLKFYAITNNKYTKENLPLETQVENAILGGVTCVQLREKSMPKIDFLNRAIKIKSICQKYGVPFIVNDNIDIALECGSCGLHIGQNDMNVLDARKLIGKSAILGVSTQTVNQAIKAQEDGANYIGVGAIFNTNSKNDAEYVTLDTLKNICENVTIPVVAIGGINKTNLGDLCNLGISGVALISTIFEHSNIAKNCLEIKKLIDNVVV